MYSFHIGQQYRRRDIYRIIGIDEDTKGGNWETGYARLAEDWFIFCNVGVPGRTGHDYANTWVDGKLVWYGKNNSHINQPSIKHMIGPIGRTYIFWRSDDQAPFTFAGCGEMDSVEDTTPVTVVWKFE